MVNYFDGIMKKIYRKNQYSGITVFGMETNEIDIRRNRHGLVECEGIIPLWPEGIKLNLIGAWDSDEKRFIITKAIPSTPSEQSSIDLLKNVIREIKERNKDFKTGNNLPKKILEISGSDIIRFMKEPDSFDRMMTHLKIDGWKIQMLYDALVQIDSASLTDFVTKFGGSVNDCSNLMKKYGKDALKNLHTHPYKVGQSIGMDFYACDAIGQYHGRNPYNKERVKAIIYEAVDRLLKSNGATYCIQSMLKKQVSVLVKKSSYPDDFIPGPMLAVKLQSMHGLKIEMVSNGVRIYKKNFYQEETKIANNLARLMKTKEELLSATELPNMVHRMEELFEIKYSKEQRESFQLLKGTGVKIITGGPGVGKTAVVNGLIHSYIEAFPNKKVALAAPTGRAAQRMWDVTTMEASTIHKLVDFLPYGDDQVGHHEDNPIDADFIVVDEMSMVDNTVFSILLPAIKSGALLLLIGDKNQLQSVAPGNVLHDLVRCGCFEVFTLSRVYRQKGKSTIIDNAYKILEGKMNLIEDEKFMLSACENEDIAADAVVESFREWMSEKDLKNIQILTPIKDGKCGTVHINRCISKMLWEAMPDSGEVFHYGKSSYQIGDRVIFHKNNYTLNYCNGDIGYVSAIIKGGIEITIGKEVKNVLGEALNDITLAYAITLHKSQGSEFGNIIIILPNTYKNMLTRNLVFTGVTRGIECVKIAYVKTALKDCIQTETINRRYTGLVDKIRRVL